MRLIHTETLELVELFGNNIPEYAILSHTWEKEEVTFEDWTRLDAAKRKTGFSKINMACRQALEDGLKYLWVDTNCIDKRSSTELSEAINSMCSWYRNASICYAYLADVEPRPSGTIPEEYWEQFRRSRWFTRGWTLQELLAPHQMVFYAKDWSKIANRINLAEEISTATAIPNDFLRRWRRPVTSASIAQRMSWLSGRETTRIEDMAYCMLGIFDINMPLLYGEGPNAFTRLQEEIIRTSTDHTIFCWNWTEMVPSEWVSLLAPCPQAFVKSGGYVPTQEYNSTDSLPFAMTNAGLSIHLPVVRAFSYHFGVLNATLMISDQERSKRRACVPLQGRLEESHIEAKGVLRRQPFPPSPLLVRRSWAAHQMPLHTIRSLPMPAAHLCDFAERRSLEHVGCSFLLLFDHSTHCRVFSQNDFKVTPGENFDRTTSLILLDNSHYHTNGVLICLRTLEKGFFRTYVIFLGALFSPSKRVLGRFGGIIVENPGPFSWSLEYGELLDLLLKDLRNGNDKTSWISGNDTINITRKTGVGLEFGDEILVGNNCIFPVFLTHDSHNFIEMNKMEYNEGRTRIVTK